MYVCEYPPGLKTTATQYSTFLKPCVSFFLFLPKGGSKQFSIFHYNWNLWKVYSFVVKDSYYFLIADVAITLQLINSCNHWHFGCHGNLTGPQINPISSIQLHFTQKVVSKLPFVLHQNCFHIKEHFLRKFKKILSRGFGATLIFCNIDVQTILMH